MNRSLLIGLVILAGCKDRDLKEARVHAAKLLRAPVICEGSSAAPGCRDDGGYFCQANDGRTVFCGGTDEDPCYVLDDNKVEPVEVKEPVEVEKPIEKEVTP